MNTETLNEYIFAAVVTRWASEIAMVRAQSAGRNAPLLDAAAVTTDDLRTALAQIELRRGVVRALRQGGPSAAPAPVNER